MDNSNLVKRSDEMPEKRVISGGNYLSERPLFGEKHLIIEDTTFDKGESPLKETEDITVKGGSFLWKYPLWYSKDIKVEGTYFGEGARAGIWYGENLEFTDCDIRAPKEFRRLKGLKLKDISIPDAKETLWHCENVYLKNVSINGDYFAMNCKNVKADHLTVNGNYCFDGCENVEIDDSKLISKDCFWNCKNVVVKNSEIVGEYLAWNSENVTLINCRIKSLQGLCYVNELKVKDCFMEGSSLCFEYSSVSADIKDSLISVINPLSGKISAKRIEKLILDPSKIDPDKIIIEAQTDIRLNEFDGIIPEE